MRLIKGILAVLISFAVIVAVAAAPIVGAWIASQFYRLLFFEGRGGRRMVECEDCGEEVVRRFTCFHCGQMVCGWCWNHVHGCGPSHKRSECKDYANYKKHGQQWINRLRARAEVVHQ